MAGNSFLFAMGRARVVSFVVIMMLAVSPVGAVVPAAAPSVLTPPAGVKPPAPDTLAPAPAPSLDDLFPPCEGVLVVYECTFTEKIYPYLNDTPWIQPYKFEALATLTNEGYSSVADWEMGITYQHGEVRSSSRTISQPNSSQSRRCQ